MAVVFLFLLNVRWSHLHRTGRAVGDGGWEPVLGHPHAWQRLSGTCTSMAWLLKEHFLQEHHSFLFKKNQTIFSEPNPSPALWAFPSLHTHADAHTHRLLPPCPNPLALPASFQLPLLSSAPIWIAQSIKKNWRIKEKCPAATIFPSHPRQNFSYVNEAGKKRRTKKKKKRKGFWQPTAPKDSSKKLVHPFD